jgi:hypothetical protein
MSYTQHSLLILIQHENGKWVYQLILINEKMNNWLDR